MKELTYEETIELEKNVKIKNDAEKLYSDFKEYFTLKVENFKDGKFKVWDNGYYPNMFIGENDCVEVDHPNGCAGGNIARQVLEDLKNEY